MAKFIALHTLKKGPEEFTKYWNDFVPGLGRAYAEAAAEGKPPPMPADCPFTWNAVPHGRNYLFCIWEAKTAGDILTSLQPLEEWITVDLFPVDEVDWGKVIAEEAKALEAEKKRK